jgi:hypothetical protein
MPTSTDHPARWTVTVSRETDAALRDLLAQRGAKKGSLSQFVEEAVKWRIFEQNLAETRAAFADLSPEELQAIANEAGEAARAETCDGLGDKFGKRG